MQGTECELHFGPVHHVEFNGGGIECSCYVRSAQTDAGSSPRVFFNQSRLKCQDLRICLLDLEFESAPPSSTTDRRCSSCVVDCGTTQFLEGSCEAQAGYSWRNLVVSAQKEQDP